MAALFAVTIVSCGGDDDATGGESGGQDGACSLTCQVDVESVYNEFGIKDEATRKISQGFSVGVMQYLYNSAGVRVKSSVASQRDWKEPSLHYQVPEGQYFLVTVVSLMTSSQSFAYYKVAYSDRLSTVYVGPTQDMLHSPFVLGVSTQSVSVSGNAEVKVTPKAVGALFRLNYYDFNQSTHATLGFYNREYSVKFRLSPSYQGDRRFESVSTGDNYITPRFEVNNTSASTVTGDCYLLQSSTNCGFYVIKKEYVGMGIYSCGKSQTLTLVDGKTYYGGFRYGDGKYYLGDKDGFDRWSGNSVTPTPTTDLLPNLYLTWGGSVSSVQSFMSGYTLTMGSTGKADYLSAGAYGLVYAGRQSEYLIAYMFSSATTGLYQVQAWYEKSRVSQADLKACLSEKYTYLGTESGGVLYASSDSKTVVLLQPYDTYWVVSFIDMNALSDSSAKPTTRCVAVRNDEVLSKVASQMPRNTGFFECRMKAQ